MKKKYLNEVRRRLQSEKSGTPEILTDNDLQHLPEPVKKYIRICGFVGKEKISNFFLKASGKIRSSEKSGWMQFTSQQYNFFESPFRIVKMLEDALAVLGDREAAVAREMTKKFEEVLRGNFSDIIRDMTARPRKGEMVVLISGKNRKSVLPKRDSE